jgi:CO/xanthine dehydrogenase Mo-binding subunit
MQLSHLFNIKPSKIRLIQPYIGGAFGAGGALHEEPIAVQLMLKTHRPVKLIFSREEVFIRGGTRAPMVIYIKDGVKKDGSLVARQITAILAGGGYGERSLAIVTRNAAFAAVGSYRIPNLKWDSYGVYVNEPPATPFRGFGNAEITWAIESHMDMLAEKLGIDPIRIRKINLLHEGDTNVTGEITHSIGAEGCLDKVVEFIKPNEKSEVEGIWRRGKGIAIGNKYSLNPSASMAKVRIMEDGGIMVYHGAEEIGTGCDTVMAQIAAEEFGISVDNVKIAISDTLYMPYDYGSVSSRATYQTGNAVRLACEDAKRQIFERAAPRLGVSPDDLDIRGGVIFVKRMQEKKVKIVELFAGYAPGRYGTYTKEGEIIGNATWSQDYAPEDRETGQIDPQLAAKGLRLNAFYAHLAKAVEVAVNSETGEVKVLKCGAAADMGQPINPKMCEQQADGGIGMGIGSAIYEEVRVKEGVVTNPNFSDYKVPTVGEMPLLENIKTETAPVPHKDGPFGSKGFGEGAMIGIDAAIGNAVYNAVGVRIRDLPISAERVLKAIKEKEAISK